MCRGAHDYRCWNAITVDGPLAAGKLIAAIRAAIAGLADFDPVLVQLVQDEVLQRQGDTGQQQQEMARRLAAVGREVQNVLAAVRAAGHSPSLLEELTRLEKEKTRLAWEQQQLALSTGTAPEVPPIAELKRLAGEAFDTLAVTSQEFGRLLRRLIPRIAVWPYRLCDGGHPVLRAHFTFSLVPLLPAAPGMDQLAAAVQRSLVVDLFEAPQRVAYRGPVLELTANGLGQREVAWELGITQPAVQRAEALGRRMATLGISDPYLPLDAPPEDYKRLRRHKHPRFRFEPLTGERPWPPPAST
jgi:hypothetical protein